MIAVQYASTAIVVGLVGLVLSNLMRLQIGFPGVFEFINAERYYQFVTMHGMIMVIYLLTALFLGGFGNYLIPLMVGARDMVFPYMNMLSFWVYLLSRDRADGQLLRARRAHRRRLDAVPAAGHPARHAGPRLGHHPDAGVAGDLHRRHHDGRPELRHHRAAGALRGHDAAAHAAVGVGHLRRHHPGAAGLSGAVRQRRDDAAGQDPGHQLLHAGAGLDGAGHRLPGRQPAAVPAPVLVLRPPRGLHRRAAGLRHRLRPHQRARAQGDLRLPHDGLGHRRSSAA